MVAEKTLSTIAGDFALNQDATKDPFAESESAIMANVSKYMTERDSARKEQLASSGFNVGSSFHAAQGVKEEEGILSNVYQSFAGARQQEELNARAADRQLIQSGVSAELEKERMASSTANQTELMKKQAELNYGVDESGAIKTAAASETERMEKQAALQEEYATASSERQKEIMTEQQRLNELSAEAGVTRQESLMETQAELTYGLDETTGQAVTAAQAEIDRMREAQSLGEITAKQSYDKQMGYAKLDDDGNPVIGEDGKPVQVEGLIDKKYNTQVSFLEEQVKQGDLAAASALQRTYGDNDPSHPGQWEDAQGNWHTSLSAGKLAEQKQALTDSNNENMRRMFGDDVLNDDGTFNESFKASVDGQGEVALQYFYTNELQLDRLDTEEANAEALANAQFNYQLGMLAAGALVGGAQDKLALTNTVVPPGK